jgi:hypothetical protein
MKLIHESILPEVNSILIKLNHAFSVIYLILSTLQNYLLFNKLKYRYCEPNQFTDSGKAIQEIPRIK